MLLFQTLLKIRKEMNAERFLDLVIEWNETNEHEENRIEDIRAIREGVQYCGNDMVNMEVLRWPLQNIIAVRYRKKSEDGIQWTTDYVMNFSESRMAVRLERTYSEDALMMYAPFSAPHFISLLIEHGYLEDDHGLKIDRRPKYIDETNADLLADIVLRGNSFDLPAVYLSRTYYDEDPVEPGLLASKLKGIAHVFSEKNFLMDPLIREKTEGNNEYHGAVGISYPGSVSEHERLFYRAKQGYDQNLMNQIIRILMEYAGQRMVDPLYTWHGVYSAMLEEDVRTQKKRTDAAEKEKDEVYELFDRDLEKYRARVEELTSAAQAKDAEILGLRKKLRNSEGALLKGGKEEEFFPLEIQEIIMDALSETLKNTKENTRRADVIKDIIDANEYPHKLKAMQDEIRSLFKGYQSMNASMRRKLQEMGFTVEEDGRHLKLVYHDDQRYATTIAKTGSDHREGQNIAAVIVKGML